MWIFIPGGLLMPATFPADLVDKNFVPEGSEFNLQIRARVTSHLENFIRDYLEPMDLAHSAIQQTPEMDYNCRIYVKDTDFAVAMARAVLDIDYEKFKPTAEYKAEDGTPLYPDGREYHGVLNSIWSTVTRLGAPGGKWATTRGSWSSGETTRGSWSSWGTARNEDDVIRNWEDRAFDRFDWEDDDDFPTELNLTPKDYATLRRSTSPAVSFIVDDMDDMRLGIEEWSEWLTAEQWSLIQDELSLAKARRGRYKADRRKARRQRRKSRV